jgi:hypothetical protein
MATTDSAPGYYVPGPLNPGALGSALRTAYTTATSDPGHDVFTLFDVMNEDHQAGLDRDQCAQVARAVLHMLMGIGALDMNDPIYALQYWQVKNRGTGSTLRWAIGETVSAISDQDRRTVQGERARTRREHQGEPEELQDGVSDPPRERVAEAEGATACPP